MTYAKLADFMDQQNPETLAAYRKGDFAARRDAGPERGGGRAIARSCRVLASPAA